MIINPSSSNRVLPVTIKSSVLLSEASVIFDLAQHKVSFILTRTSEVGIPINLLENGSLLSYLDLKFRLRLILKETSQCIV